MQSNTTDGSRMQKLIIRIVGLAIIVSGVSLFMLVVFADMAYPRVTQCVDMIIGESQCREYGARPVFLDPIMNSIFSIGMLALAASGAAVLGVYELTSVLKRKASF
jgi:hypothetical protein